MEWDDKKVDAYFTANNLPRHPLSAKGYVTVGDTHSSRPVGEGETGRETRFKGKHAECGMHLEEDADILAETAEQKKERLEKMAADAEKKKETGATDVDESK